MRILPLLYLTVSLGVWGLFGQERSETKPRDEATAGSGDVSPERAESSASGKKKPRAAEHQTPFGVMRVKVKEEPAAASASSDTGLRFTEIEEQGEFVVFRRDTPFGAQSWKKKRSELTDEDRELMKQVRAAQAGKRGTLKSADRATKPADKPAAPPPAAK
jgi:hypothetical protein